MKAIIGAVLMMMMAAAAFGQTYMEPPESQTVMESDRQMGTETSPDSLVFRVGDADTVRSAIYLAMKYTTVYLTAVGDSVAVKIYFYGGRADRLAGQDAADNLEFQYELKDSLTVTGAGPVSRQISAAFNKCKTFYFMAIGQTGNGHGTYLKKVWALRERY